MRNATLIRGWASCEITSTPEMQWLSRQGLILRKEDNIHLSTMVKIIEYATERTSQFRCHADGK